jgi:hypothetical protein
VPDNHQPAREFLELRVNFLTKARIATAAVGTALALSTIAACGASSGTGSIAPSGTAHGTFRYCSYTPDSDGIEISHHEATPCVVGDARSKKDRKKKAKPAKTVYVPVRPTSSATGRSSHGSATKSPTAKPTTAAPKATKTPVSLKKLPKPRSTKH